MLYGPNRCQWRIPQAALVIRYWKARAFCAVISAWWVKTRHQGCRFWNETMPKETQIFLFPQLLSWEVTILLSSKATLLSNTGHKLGDQRQDFFFFPPPLYFSKLTGWPLVLYTFETSSEMHIRWVWFFFLFCFSEGVEQFHLLHQSHTSGCVKRTEGL